VSVAVSFRAAAVEDARAIAEVHVEGWRWGYRDILPATVLDTLDVDERTARWTALLTDPRPGDRRVVAVDAGGPIVGFVATGAADDDVAPPPEGAGELFAIYLRDGWQGRGLGRGLLAAARRSLAEAGFAVAVLWVFDANERARRVYEAGGWRPDGATGVHRFEGGERAVLRYELQV